MILKFLIVNIFAPGRGDFYEQSTYSGIRNWLKSAEAGLAINKGKHGGECRKPLMMCFASPASVAERASRGASVEWSRCLLEKPSNPNGSDGLR
ncbi:MAG: hypothetical protein LIP09_16665 [Bacteroidales bacterium]|nr:hypothetical protein [Bacteroidales bacterium]